MQGAGGTDGGIGKFFVGLGMMGTGGYLLLDAIRVTSGYHWRMPLYNWGGFQMTSGSILIVFVIGIGALFYDGKNILGWSLTCGSLVAMVFGILRRLQFYVQPMSLFDLLLMLVLLFGGAGLFLNSLREQKLSESREAP